MAGLTNIIEEFIVEMIKEANDGVIEIQRNEMAQHFECAPSQINYVLTTRFTPYKGYYIESRRGGGGYIKIEKVRIDEDENMRDLIINTIGFTITKGKSYDIVEALYEEDVLSKRELKIIKAAISDRVLKDDIENKNIIRANILKNILLILID